MLVDRNGEGDRREDYLGRGEEGDAEKVSGRNRVRELLSQVIFSSKTECENLVSPPLDGLILWESVERRTRKMWMRVDDNGWSGAVPSRA